MKKNCQKCRSEITKESPQEYYPFWVVRCNCTKGKGFSELKAEKEYRKKSKEKA